MWSVRSGQVSQSVRSHAQSAVSLVGVVSQSVFGQLVGRCGQSVSQVGLSVSQVRSVKFVRSQPRSGVRSLSRSVRSHWSVSRLVSSVSQSGKVSQSVRSHSVSQSVRQDGQSVKSVRLVSQVSRSLTLSLSQVRSVSQSVSQESISQSVSQSSQSVWSASQSVSSVSQSVRKVGESVVISQSVS